MKNNYILYSLVGIVVVFALTLSMFTSTSISVPELFEVENVGTVPPGEEVKPLAEGGNICRDGSPTAPKDEAPPEDNGDGDNPPPDDF